MKPQAEQAAFSIVGESGIQDGQFFEITSRERDSPETFGLHAYKTNDPGPITAGAHRLHAHGFIEERAGYDTAFTYLIL
ncbi:MAG TPA: hypothetical protein PK878_20710 [bacterium]|nr:hypothetical protein [bacterium]